MQPQALLMLGLCSLAPALCGQQVATSPAVELKPSGKVELPFSQSYQMGGRTKCDGAGRLYGRPMDVSPGGAPKEEFTAPVRAIAPKRDPGEIFRLPAAFADRTSTGGIFVSGDGRVFQVAGQVYVVEFAKDGWVNSKTALQTGPDVTPRHLAVFKSGRFLLIGEADHAGHTPYTAVFEPDGRPVKKIFEPEDGYARGQVEAGDTQFVGGTVSGFTIGNRFVSEGDVTLADDGNAYVMHGASPTVVYAVSPMGEVVRKFRVASSEPGQPAWSIKSYGHRLALAYPDHGRVEIQVTDLEGAPIAGYQVPASNAIADLACYDSSGFTLITVDASSNLYLLQAKPQ